MSAFDSHLLERAAACGVERPLGGKVDHYGRRWWYHLGRPVLTPNGQMGWWCSLGPDTPFLWTEEDGLRHIIEHLETTGIVA